MLFNVFGLNKASESQRKMYSELSACISHSHRDRLLPQWLPLLAECPVNTRMYEENALLRDKLTVSSLIGVLETLNDFPITLETSFTKSVEL